MDYEKLYKDALEKQGEKKYDYSEEDEKIRKSILSGLKYLETEFGWDTVGNVDILDAYAWLEKQDESKVSEPNWCHHKVDLSAYSEEYRKAYYDGWNNCNIQHSQCNEERNDVVK